ncbi:FadR/GntR family transcriptional regulator [Mycobacterium heckeshornense]|uniref:GntR family transcriptional regulator n=1 Tax=Mycobacterium heckeshornense TaxID=110505 RepID=A0A7R7JI19_9MYCO|nr:FCD domain-containing protein [Mycobacterium heckeshornense]MCV7033643.1 FadR family transcriptional regulator [Mycobacterium heckeshornense]BCO36471.1 GntR family transcriptional regulator [Mycobacterium heckeshornense]
MTTAKPARAPEVVAATLRRRILSGELAPGDSLPPEAELVSQLGVSRETVRLALRLLAAEGLTRTSQGRAGVRIRHPEPERVARSLVQLLTLTGATWGDLLAFRKMLEPAAAAHVAEHASPAERAAIAEVAERGIAPDGAGYHEFHELVVRASGNPILTTVLAAVEQAVRWAAAEQDITQYDREEAARSHRAIASAITAGDARKAEHRMRQHLEAALQHVEASGLLGAPMIPPSRWRGDNTDLPWR